MLLGLFPVFREAGRRRPERRPHQPGRSAARSREGASQGTAAFNCTAVCSAYSLLCSWSALDFDRPRLRRGRGCEFQGEPQRAHHTDCGGGGGQNHHSNSPNVVDPADAGCSMRWHSGTQFRPWVMEYRQIQIQIHRTRLCQDFPFGDALNFDSMPNLWFWRDRREPIVAALLSVDPVVRRPVVSYSIRDDCIRDRWLCSWSQNLSIMDSRNRYEQHY